jgi:hypothetical protein
VLHQRLREDWLARLRNGLIDPLPRFAEHGLMLGAGTVLLARESRGRRLQQVEGQEARLVALLSAALGEVLPVSVAGNIERAAKCWSEGDHCLAYVHLSHAKLPASRDALASACRLLVAERAMIAGVAPQIILQALRACNLDGDLVRKFDPSEPRVPAGSGPTSGEWTNSDGASGNGAATVATGGDGTAEQGTQGPSLLGRMPSPPPASFMSALDAAQVAELGAYASRILGLAPVSAAAAAAAAVFGLLFVPSPNNVRVDGEVPEIPGLRYAWNRDQTLLHLTYDRGGGAQRTYALQVDGDFIRDDDGKVVGRVVGGNRIAIDTIAVLPDLVKQDQPRLCPAPAPDVPGSDQGKTYEENRSRQYEDFVKRLINPPPDGPTPSGFVYYLPLPEGDEQSYDDCMKLNGFLFEIKGEGLAKLTNDLPNAIASKFASQATRQLAASGGRPVIWIFAEEEAAFFARELFDNTPGLDGITIAHVPWVRSGR